MVALSAGGRGLWSEKLRIGGSLRIFVACLVGLAAAACASVDLHPVPAPLVSQAAIPGLGHVRFWGDEVPSDVAAFLQPHMPSLTRMVSRNGPVKGRALVEYLALSG